MYAKIVDHTLMGRRKNILQGPPRVMMKAKPNIKVLVDESPYVAIEVVNPTIHRVLLMNHHLLPLRLIIPPQIRFVLMNHHLLPLRLLIPPQIRFLLMNHHVLPLRLLISPQIRFLLMNHHLLLLVVNPTINKVLNDESPSITSKVVNPTINNEGNGGGQTNLQGRPTMLRAKPTRPPVHDHIAQREELRKEKKKKHKQTSCARLATTNDKTKGLLLSTLASNGSSECSRTFSTKGARRLIVILAKNYVSQLVQDLRGYELEI